MFKLGRGPARLPRRSTIIEPCGTSRKATQTSSFDNSSDLGTWDKFLEQAVAQASLDLCDRGESLLLNTATHWVQPEEAKAVNAAAIRFFKAA
jgi:hypothetical protein